MICGRLLGCCFWLVLGISLGDELEARRFTITAAPRFDQVDVPDLSVKWLRLDDGPRHHSLLWSWNTNQVVPVTLATNLVYAFTILERQETSFLLPVTTNTSLKLIRIELDGSVLFDIETCELHRLQMRWKPVPISYGLVVRIPGASVPSLAEEREMFPNRARPREGGCSVLPTKTFGGFVCEECDIAFEKRKTNRFGNRENDNSGSNSQK